MKTRLDFTHTVKLKDIRKIVKNAYDRSPDASYMLIFEGIHQTLYLPASIFETAVEKYFLNKNYTRQDLFSIQYKLVITTGYYLKYDAADKTYFKMAGIDDIKYLNFITVDAGLPLDQQYLSIDVAESKEVSL